MRQIYLNYASTSPVKSPRVIDAVTGFLQENRHLNAGRNFEGLDDTVVSLKSRMAICKLFGVANPSYVIFTSGVTMSLNMILHGALSPGDHVLSTSVEHNAVARPLTQMEQSGLIKVTWLPCDPSGLLDPALVGKAVRKNTRLMVMSHASNVLGTIQPVAECFREAKSYGLLTVLDSAQTAGGIDIRMGEEIDVLAFTGHKGLCGLAGTGGFALAPGVDKRIYPWLTGGTGSASHLLEQPDFLPDKYEPGTPNTVGILSLGAAVTELLELGVSTIREKETAITRRFIEGAKSLPVVVCGTGNAEQSMPVVSLDVPGVDLALLARRLYDDHGIITRSGLHCSPLAHRTAGTFPKGTLRFSFGRETTEEEIDTALAAVRGCI